MASEHDARLLQGLPSTFYLDLARTLCRPGKDAPGVPLSNAALGYWTTLRKRAESGESVNDRTWLLTCIADHLRALGKHAGSAGGDPAMRELITVSVLQHFPLTIRCKCWLSEFSAR